MWGPGQVLKRAINRLLMRDYSVRRRLIRRRTAFYQRPYQQNLTAYYARDHAFVVFFLLMSVHPEPTLFPVGRNLFRQYDW